MNVPSELTFWLESHSRREAIHEHGFNLNTGWWNQRISDLPGGPIGHGANTAYISRSDLFSMAEPALTNGEGALQLFWHTLAWGSGGNHRNNPRRISSVRSDPQGVGEVLCQAAQASRTDPIEAFKILKPRQNVIKQLGPNFFTKYLYFAGGGAPSHRALIIDNRVLQTLRRETNRKEFSIRGNYGPTIYTAAIEQLEEWAKASSTPERTVAADEVERWAFQAR